MRFTRVSLCIIGCWLAACADDVEVTDAPNIEFASEFERRVLLDTTNILVALVDTLPTIEVDTTNMYEFANPRALSARGFPNCMLAVADGDDMAVHLLSLSGRLLRSLPLPPEVSADRSMYRVSLGVDGTIVVSDNSVGWIAVAHKGQLPWSIFSPSRLVPGSRVGSALAQLEQGEIIDHWSATGFSRRDSGWAKPLPLMRVFRIDGSRAGTIGEVRSFGGSTLTSALNRGIPAVRQDTVYILNRSFARVLVFPAGSTVVSPTRVIDLPIGYRPRPPRDFYLARQDRSWQQVDELASGFAISESGRLLTTQQLSFEVDSATGSPRSIIVVASMDGRPEALIDTRGAVRALSTASNWIFALAASKRYEKSRVVRIRLDSATRASNRERGSSECGN